MSRIRSIACALISGLVFVGAALAQESPKTGEAKTSGEVSAAGVLTDVAGNRAKFNEYRDPRDGLYGRAKARYDSPGYFLDFNARDMGYDTQKYEFEGRKWGDFRFDIRYDEIPHNFTFDAKSFYNGIGTSNLSFPGPSPGRDVSTWNTFDYSVKRKNYGAGFKLDTLRPFFFDAVAGREDRRGIYPLGVAGTGPGGIAIELPVPVNYRTDNIRFAAGYNKNPFFLSLGFFLSRFENSNSDLDFRNPATTNTAATTDTLTLPPGNHFSKADLKGSMRLPFKSKLDLDMATATATSDGKLSTSYVSDVTAAASDIGEQGRTGIGLGSPVFHGKIETRRLGVALTSKPANFMDAKVFLKYNERENKSDQVTITDTAQDPSVFTNPLFDYRKVYYGTELGFQLPAKFYLRGSYTHGSVSRRRDDISENRDDLYGVDLRWKGTGFMSARLGYERLDRRADFQAGADPDSLEPFIRRFDAADKARDTYKATLEFFPRSDLSFSLSYKHRDTDYRDTILGLRSDRDDEFSLDADYRIGKRARIFAFFDYDRIRLNQFQRQLPAGPGSAVDPSTPPTTTSFNWTAEQLDETYSYSLGSDIYIIPDKLTLRLQHSYVKSSGSVDYTYLLGSNPLPAGRTQDNIDIPNWDDYRLRYYLIMMTYRVTGSFSVEAGYAYEKYSYGDAQYDGYQYVPAVTGTNGAFLTGAYSAPAYESHLVFTTVSYRF